MSVRAQGAGPKAAAGGRKPSGKGSRTAAAKDAKPAFDAVEVEAIVERLLNSMEGELTIANVKLYRELESLAVYIENAKTEIAALSPDEINSTHIPKATDELDAIIVATEGATHAIMSAAEKIESVTGAVSEEVNATLTDAVTAIYEACSFQDITGQRITKIVKTLKHIDEKVAALVGALARRSALTSARFPGPSGPAMR